MYLQNNLQNSFDSDILRAKLTSGKLFSFETKNVLFTYVLLHIMYVLLFFKSYYLQNN